MMNLNNIRVHDIRTVANKMFAEGLEGKCVYAVLFFDAAVELMRTLLNHDVDVSSIDIGREHLDGYGREYYISYDNITGLSVEKAWHEKNEWNDAGYLYFDADVLYIDSDASSSILGKQGNEKCKTYELTLECFDGYDPSDEDVVDEDDIEDDDYDDDDLDACTEDNVLKMAVNISAAFRTLSNCLEALLGAIPDKELDNKETDAGCIGKE